MPRSRAERGANTARIVVKRFTDARNTDWGDRWKQPSNIFSDHQPSGLCDCRKTRKGRPRVAGGMCCIGCRDRHYTSRHLTHHLNNLLSRGYAPDSDEVALVTPRRLRE